ncbi:MAG: hypothetical protein JSS75_11780 [Bacteroidetes bacterium]|nr:hypothetical protein [Bacteroidota bacterium]
MNTAHDIVQPRRSISVAAVIAFVFVMFSSGCQTIYTYRLPNDAERQRNNPDSTRWTYDGQSITSIPVVDESGRFYRLAVDAKTKIEVRDIYGTTYRFYLQTIKVEDNDVSIGGGKRWTGYELLNHAQASVSVTDISTVKILSDSKAVMPIAIH